MKKYIALLLLVCSEALCASTGMITLQGIVPASTHIVITPISGYNSLDFTVNATNLPVFNVREINNTPNGYTVTVVSTNGSRLKNGAAAVPYTARYNGTTVTLSNTPTVITNVASQVNVVNVLKQFDISFVGSPNEDRPQGTYSDTLTFSITAN